MSRNLLYLLALILGLSTFFLGCNEPDTPVDEARRLAAASEYESALRILKAERQQSGLSAELGYLMGGVYEAMGEPSSAASIYRKTAEAFPGSADVELRLATIFLDLGQNKASLSRLKKAREAGKSDLDVSLSMAVAHGLLGQFQEASDELDRAEKAGVPAFTVSYNRALILRQSGNDAGSLELLRKAYEAKPDDPSVLRELARAELTAAGSDDLTAIARAEELINECISRNDESGRDDWRAYEVLGDCFNKRNDYEAASEMYLKAKEIGQEPDPALDDKYYDAQVALRALLESDNG